MTEEEAKTKLCPMAYRSNEDGAHAMLCGGSACMAWRQDPLRKPSEPGQHPALWPTVGYRGYCGLAGVPTP